MGLMVRQGSSARQAIWPFGSSRLFAVVGHVSCRLGRNVLRRSNRTARECLARLASGIQARFQAITLSQRERGTVAGLVLLALVAILSDIASWAGGGRKVPIEALFAAPLTHAIDLNRASQAELESLPGVGPTLAERIVLDRAQRGWFASVDDLGRVRGIGPKTLERLRPWVSVMANSEQRP